MVSVYTVHGIRVHSVWYQFTQCMVLGYTAYGISLHRAWYQFTQRMASGYIVHGISVNATWRTYQGTNAVYCIRVHTKYMVSEYTRSTWYWL